MEDGTSCTPNTHLEYQWARGQYSETRPPIPIGPRASGLPPAAIDIVKEEIARAFRDKLEVNMTHKGQSY
jgi:hypothetical protein